MLDLAKVMDVPRTLNQLLMITVTIVIKILCSSFQVSQTELITNGRSFSSSDQTGNSSITTLNEEETAAAFLPPSLFQSITNHGNIGSFYAVYNTGVLFPIAKTAPTDQEMNTSVITVVGSPVLAATIGLRQNFRGLTEPVRILLRLNDLGVSDRNGKGVHLFSLCVAYLATFPPPPPTSFPSLAFEFSFTQRNSLGEKLLRMVKTALNLLFIMQKYARILH